MCRKKKQNRKWMYVKEMRSNNATSTHKLNKRTRMVASLINFGLFFPFCFDIGCNNIVSPTNHTALVTVQFFIWTLLNFMFQVFCFREGWSLITFLCWILFVSCWAVEKNLISIYRWSIFNSFYKVNVWSDH